MTLIAPTPIYLPARYYAVLAGRLQQWGVDLAALLTDAHIEPAALMSPEGQLRPEQVERLIELAASRCNRSDLGFELGGMLKLSSHDILGYAMLSAPTADQALRLASRYFGLITPTYALRYRSDPRQAEIVLRPLLAQGSLVSQVHLEAMVVASYQHVRVLLSGQAPHCRIELAFDAPPHAGRYRELHAATVHFGLQHLPGARIVLDPEQMRQPLAMADDNALRMAEARCAALFQRITHASSLTDWVCMMLREASEGQPGLVEIAGILNLSPRTLERRLKLEGSRFRHLARRARFEAACALLAAGRLSVTQIAYQLGYTDVGNFTRAFRREAGVPPSRFMPPASPATSPSSTVVAPPGSP